MLKLSVLIPTYNRRQLLEGTLRSLFAQQIPASEYEIVVAVDGSTDDTASWLRSLSPECGLRVIEQSHRGRIDARNAALGAASGELLLIMDDDIVCPPALLAEHLAAHANSEECVCFGANAVADDAPDTIFTDWARVTFASWRAELDRYPTPAWWHHFTMDANFSVSRSLLRAHGGYDTRFQTREIELGFRLWRAGVPLRFLPQATAYHIYDKHDDMVRVDAGAYGREEVLLCRAHPEYRTVSALAAAESGSTVSRIARSWLARAPLRPDIFLRKPFAVAASLRKRGTHKLAVRLLCFRQSTAMVRGAMKEAGSASAYQREFAQRLPVLAYHYVGPNRPGTHPGLTVSQAQFERQMRGLKRHGYVPISAEQWRAWLFRATPLPPRPVLISFDDGYADLAEHAFPVLQRCGFAALVFVATGTLGATNAWDEEAGWGTYQILSAQQIRFWAERGILFGAHSRTHPDLKRLTDEALEDEVAGSKSDLAAILGHEPRAFAYPYGSHDERVRNCVARHFDLAFTADPGCNTLATDRFQLCRFVVNPTDGWLGLATRVWFDPLQRVRNVLGVRSRIRRTRTEQTISPGEAVSNGA